MVRVPEYQPDQSLRPNYRQGIDVRATPDAAGAAIGKGMQAFAQGMSNLSDSMAEVRALEDEARVRDQRTAYMRERDALLYDPENGYLNTQGKNAIDGREAFTSKMGDLRRKYAQGLTPSQSVLFNRSVDTLDLDASRAALQHNARELKGYVIQQGEASAASFREEAIRNVGDKQVADKYLSAGIMELRQNGAKQGLPAEQIALKEKEYISNATAAMVKQIALKDPIAADNFLKENRNRLTEGDRLSLETAMESSLYEAKGRRNAMEIVRGTPAPAQAAAKPAVGVAETEDDVRRMEAEMERTAPKGAAVDPVSGVKDAAKAPASTFNQVVGSLYGLNERTDGAAIASFIKRSTGINIDPAVTPWCAAFVNAVLATQGIDGTGKLNARSFLNFGMATDAPKPGDIVVLTRGGPNAATGHVGFFQGFDENGNVRVLGGNQNNAVNVSTYSADRVLGYRTAGAVNADTAGMPNYSPQGLLHIQQKLATITDPKEYAATQKAVDAYLTQQKRFMDAQRDQVVDATAQQLIQNPSLDLMTLPLDTQRALGKSGMTSLIEFQNKLRTQGDPRTDDSVMFDLMTMDPEQMSGMTKEQLFQARSKLSNADWDRVVKRYEGTRSDIRKAKEEHINLTEAFSLANRQLEAVGIKDDPKRVGQFQNVLASEMDAFKRTNNGRNPNPMEVQSMINRLLLPVVIKTPGALFGSLWPVSEDKRLFEAGARADNSTVDVNVTYEEVPVDLRRGISARLERDTGRKPTKKEIADEYERFLLGQKPAQR